MNDIRQARYFDRLIISFLRQSRRTIDVIDSNHTIITPTDPATLSDRATYDLAVKHQIASCFGQGLNLLKDMLPVITLMDDVMLGVFFDRMIFFQTFIEQHTSFKTPTTNLLLILKQRHATKEE